ncbi:MAG TPA: hypothetical protein VGU73_08585, partial [Acidimicrobiia bacterium]|nr:hypothetical protein [Acidimicrobiia bacterium]
MTLGWHVSGVDGPIAADPTNNALWAMNKGAHTLDEVDATTGAVKHTYNVSLDGSQHFPTPEVNSNGTWVVTESGTHVVGVQVGSTSSTPTWTSPALDGFVQSRPVIANNVVVVATEGDSVYGLSLTTGAFVWTTTDATTSDHGQTLGTPESQAQNNSLDSGAVNGCGDIWPLGITSNLVAAPNGDVYAVGEVQTGTTTTSYPDFQVMAVNPATGAQTLTPTSIVPTSMKTAPVQIEAEQQRAGLFIGANSNVYVGFGGLSGDCGTYHGYEVVVSEAGSVVGDFESTAISNAGAIWATAGGAVDSGGTVYVSTGNNTRGNPPSGTDYTDGVVAVPANISGEITAPGNFFQPAEWKTDNDADADLGSAAPVLLPNGTQLFVIGKQHNAFLLNASALGGFDHETPVGRLNGACSGESFGQNAALGNSAYFNCTGTGMVQVVFS